MAKEFVVIKVSIKGQQRTLARLNRIMGNVPVMTNMLTDKVMRQMKSEAQNIIRTQTDGSGLLADSMVIRKEKMDGKDKKSTKWTLGFDGIAERYAKFVHDGFTPHWVKISDKIDLQMWLQKHFDPDVYQKMLNRDRIFIGGPNCAPWIKEGGTKFFERAYRKIWEKSKAEYDKTIKNIIRGK